MQKLKNQVDDYFKRFPVFYENYKKALELLCYVGSRISIDTYLMIVGILLLFFSRYFLTTIMVFDAIRLMYWDNIKKWIAVEEKQEDEEAELRRKKKNDEYLAAHPEMKDRGLIDAMFPEGAGDTANSTADATAALVRLCFMISMTAATTMRWKFGQCTSLALAIADFLNDIMPLQKTFPALYKGLDPDSLPHLVLDRAYFIIAFIISSLLLSTLCVLYSVLMGSKLVIHGTLRTLARNNKLPKKMVDDLLARGPGKKATFTGMMQPQVTANGAPQEQTVYTNKETRLGIAAVALLGFLWQLSHWNSSMPILLLPFLLPIRIFDTILTVVA